MNGMSFDKAIEYTARLGSRYPRVIETLYKAVAPICTTETDPPDDTTTSLYDWLAEGDYTGNETPESLAQEWDALSDHVDFSNVADTGPTGEAGVEYSDDKYRSVCGNCGDEIDIRVPGWREGDGGIDLCALCAQDVHDDASQ